MLANFFETFIITFAIVFLAGYALRSFGPKLEDEESEELKLVEQFEDAIVLCKVEQQGDMFYLYNAQNDMFVGQARNVEEFTTLSDRLQKHLMIVDGDKPAIEQLKKLTSEISNSK